MSISMFLVSYLLFIFHPTLPGTFIYFIYVFALENFSTWYSSSVNYSLSISMPYSSHGYSCLMLPVVPIFSGIIFMLNFWSSLFFFHLYELTSHLFIYFMIVVIFCLSTPIFLWQVLWLEIYILKGDFKILGLSFAPLVDLKCLCVYVCMWEYMLGVFCMRFALIRATTRGCSIPCQDPTTSHFLMVTPWTLKFHSRYLFLFSLSVYHDPLALVCRCGCVRNGEGGMASIIHLLISPWSGWSPGVILLKHSGERKKAKYDHK